MRGNLATWSLWGLIGLCLGLVGFSISGVPGALVVLLLLALVVALAPRVFGSGMWQANGTQPPRGRAILFGLLGSVIGCGSALAAFLAVGADPLYHDRLWAGWVALLLPVLAFLSTLWLRARPFPASMLILVSGLGGFICINLFYINTFYVLALPFWVAAVIVGLARTGHMEAR